MENEARSERAAMKKEVLEFHESFARRDGTNTYYRIANTKITRACSLMQPALAQLMKGMPVVQSKKSNRASKGARQ